MSDRAAAAATTVQYPILLDADSLIYWANELTVVTGFALWSLGQEDMSVGGAPKQT